MKTKEEEGKPVRRSRSLSDPGSAMRSVAPPLQLMAALPHAGAFFFFFFFFFKSTNKVMNGG